MAGKPESFADSPVTRCVADDCEPEFETLGPTHILPHLYIGCMKDAYNQDVRKSCGITHLLNVTASCPKPDDVVDNNYHRIPINDGYIDQLLPYVDEACAFIDEAKDCGGVVLVHCMAGISRSAAVTIAYIMKRNMMTCEQAYRFVKTRRPIVSPNFNFLGQLLDFQRKLNITQSPTSNAGQKRKILDFDLEGPSIDLTASARTVNSKRLLVNNNSLSSLSPASALETLRFEHSLESLGTSSTDVGRPAVSTRLCLIPPPVSSVPKRCRSWNGLAELAYSAPGSPTGVTSNMRKSADSAGSRPSRPRSLNLSMSNLSVPPAVLELNAQVTNSCLSVIGNDSNARKPTPGTVIPDGISEESECLGSSHTHEHSSSSSSSQERLEKLIEPLPTKELCSASRLSVSDMSRDLSTSQPSLQSIVLSGDHPLSNLHSTISNIQNARHDVISSAQTAPCDLNKTCSNAHVCSLGSSSPASITHHRANSGSLLKSRSLDNLISASYPSSGLIVCMKCGRMDVKGICHGVTHKLDAPNLTKTDSLHSSCELIQVS